MNMADIKQVHVIVTGRVQGVFFRAETKQAADRFQLNGWVRNLPNGTVEAIFEGKEESIAEMLVWCKSGPPLSMVENIEATPMESAPMESNEFTSFSIRY